VGLTMTSEMGFITSKFLTFPSFRSRHEVPHATLLSKEERFPLAIPTYSTHPAPRAHNTTPLVLITQTC
jgi:hypothetical protein